MVPGFRFQLFYVLVVLKLDTREILHVNVTEHPTAEWTAQQLVEAFPGDKETPRFLIRDRDGIYGETFQRTLEAVGIEQVVTGPRMPRMNAYVERVIGTLRRECTDHIIPLGDRHLLQTLREYVAYYNEARPHESLQGNSPLPRRVDAADRDIVATPVLGGLHHTYRQAA